MQFKLKKKFIQDLTVLRLRMVIIYLSLYFIKLYSQLSSSLYLACIFTAIKKIYELQKLVPSKVCAYIISMKKYLKTKKTSVLNIKYCLESFYVKICDSTSIKNCLSTFQKKIFLLFKSKFQSIAVQYTFIHILNMFRKL